MILGAGRQGRNISDICSVLRIEVLGFLDDTKPRGETVNQVAVLGGFELAEERELLDEADFIVGLGDNRIRRRLSNEIRARGGRLATVVHPSCAISPSARIGVGVYINACSRVLANACVGDYALIEGLATVGTDTIVGEAALIGSGCQLIGGSRVGTMALIGAGAVIVENTSVGDYSVIGAGATVVADIPDHVLAVGTPARVKRCLR